MYYYHYLIALILCGSIYVNSAQLFTASPTILSTSGDTVELKWSGIETPTRQDVIGIYYPPEGDVTAPIGFIPMTNSTTWKEGYGSVSLPLINVRDVYVFRIWVPGTIEPFINNGGSNLSMVATTNTVSFENPNEPGKAYLALTNKTSEMRLMWISGTDDTPIVHYGLSAQMCEAPANDPTYFRSPGFIHDAVMTGLTESTQYFYTFGSQQSGFTSKVYSFVAAPELGTEAYMVAFGDLGLNAEGFNLNAEIQYPARQTADNIYTTITAPLNLSPFASKLGKTSANGNNTPPPWNIQHIGDISYARGNAFVWDYYHAMVEDFTSKASYMVSIGNHEYDFPQQPFYPSWSDYGSDSGGECGVPYFARYHMLGAEGPSRNLWYSYNYGPVHTLVFSAEHDFLPGSPQYNWIQNDLKNVDRSLTPWVIVQSHRPMYCTTEWGGEVGMYNHLQDSLEPLLIEYDVNLCFWGHVHVYERICGINNYTCAASDNDAPVHEPWQPLNTAPDGWGHFPQPNYSVFRAVNYGYTRFYSNQTHLYFEYVGNSRNIVHDHFWLESKYSKRLH
eukprot:gene10867-12661_t